MSGGCDDDDASQEAPDAYSAWFLACSDGLAMIDADTRIREANPALARLLGCHDELREQKLGRWLVPHPSLGALSKVLAGDAAIAPCSCDDEWTVKLSRDLEVPVRLRLARGPRPNMGNPTWLVWLRADDDRRDRARQRQVADQLATVGLLAGSAAHEIKNDLAPLVGYLSLLEGSDSEGMVSLMRESVRRIQAHVEGILEPLRPRVRARGPVVLATAVADTSSRLKRSGRLRRLTLEVAVPEDIVVHADKAEVAQLLLNLLTNATDALGDGGGAMRGTVDVEAFASDGVAHVRVRDSGRGFDAAMRDACFRDFTSTKAARGTGLGLPVARDIVHALGGSIEIESTDSSGTCVRVQLPLFGSDQARD